jgi:hypothetical protein
LLSADIWRNYERERRSKQRANNAQRRITGPAFDAVFWASARGLTGRQVDLSPRMIEPFSAKASRFHG